jgi:hypothetical protein
MAAAISIVLSFRRGSELNCFSASSRNFFPNYFTVFIKFNDDNNAIQFETGHQESMNLQEIFVRKLSWNPRHLQSCRSCLAGRDCAEYHMCDERQALLQRLKIKASAMNPHRDGITIQPNYRCFVGGPRRLSG